MHILLPSQEQQLLAAVDPNEPFGPRDRSLIRFTIHTGLRSHELCSLNVDHVLTRDGLPREWVDLVGKGNCRRRVPLNAVARQCVLDIVQFNRSRGFAVTGESPLLMTRFHKRLPTRSLRDRIQTYRERADLDVKCSPHWFRHTMASRLASRASLPVVKSALGHKWLSSTQVYAQVTPAELVAGMDRLAVS